MINYFNKKHVSHDISMIMYRFYLLYLLVLLSTSTNSVKIKFESLTQRIKDLHYQNGFLLIDGDNCRGKLNFQVSKQQLAEYIYTWMIQLELNLRTILYFDHGQEPSAYHYYQDMISSITSDGLNITDGTNTIMDSEREDSQLQNNTLSRFQKSIIVRFSGISLTVDDCIVKDLRYIQHVLKKDVIVITEDQELRTRCRKNAMDSSHSKKSVKKSTKLKKEIRSMRIENDLINNYSSYCNNHGDGGDRNIKTLALIDSSGFMEYLYSFLHMNIETTKISPRIIPTRMNKLEENNTRLVLESHLSPISSDSSKENSKLDYIRQEILREQVELKQTLDLLQTTLETTTSKRIKTKLTLSCDQLEKKYKALVSAYQRIQSWEDPTQNQDQLQPQNNKNNLQFIEPTNSLPENLSTNPNRIASDRNIGSQSYDVYDEGVKLFKRMLSNGRAVNPIGVNGAEETWERIILAEKFRQELMLLPLPIPLVEQSVDSITDKGSSSSSSIMKVTYSLNTSTIDHGEDYITTDSVHEIFSVGKEMMENQRFFELNSYISYVTFNSHLHPNRKNSNNRFITNHPKKSSGLLRIKSFKRK